MVWIPEARSVAAMSRPTRSALLRMPRPAFTTGGWMNAITFSPRGAPLRRRVAVVAEGLELDLHLGREALELRQLVLREGLRREEVQRTRRRVLRDRVEDREVVAEGLARGGRRDHDDVLLLVRYVERGGLVRVERLDAARTQAARDPRVEPVRERRVPRSLGRDALPVG